LDKEDGKSQEDGSDDFKDRAVLLVTQINPSFFHKNVNLPVIVETEVGREIRIIDAPDDVMSFNDPAVLARNDHVRIGLATQDARRSVADAPPADNLTNFVSNGVARHELVSSSGCEFVNILKVQLTAPG
jgi:hypothetical protein